MRRSTLFSGMADFVLANAGAIEELDINPLIVCARRQGRLDRGRAAGAEGERQCLMWSRTRREGGILEVTLDRPKANAIDLATSRLMGETFQAFRDDPELRVAIVKTAGDKFFCAGWDLKAAADGDAVDGDYGVGGFAGLQELRDMNKPVIACVNGMAVGGGFELALSCDLIYASDHSSFALPEIRAGTLADAATVKLPKRIPYHVAMDLLLTGRWMDVQEAHRWGLVNEVLPKEKLEDRVWEIARLLAGGPPLVFAAIKEVAREAEAMTFQDAMNWITKRQVPHGRRIVWLRGQPGRLSRVCRETRPGVEGQIGSAVTVGEPTTMPDYKKLIDAETWAFIERTNSYYPPDTVDYTLAEQRQIYDRMCREFHAGYPEGVTAERFGDLDAGARHSDPYLPLCARALRQWCCISMAAASSSAVLKATTMSAPNFARAPASKSSRSTTGWRPSICILRPSTMRWRPSNGLRRPASGLILLCGDSAGGNLAAAVSHATRGHKQRPAGQVLIYPGLGGDHSRGSYVTHAEAPMLTLRDLDFYKGIRTAGRDATGEINFSPLADANFANLPPTVIITAECDPLSSDGEAYGSRIQAAGGKAWWFEEPGLVHGYLRARHSVGARPRELFADCRSGERAWQG